MPALQWDASVRRFGAVLLGGSPLRLFRLGAAGVRVADAIDAGAALPAGHEPLTERWLDAGVVHPVYSPDEAHSFGFDAVTMVVPSLGGGLPTGDLPRTVVLVDDGSQPPLAPVLDDRAIEVTVVRREVSGGPATARTNGLAVVSTPLVAFVDADVHLPDGWWRPLLAHFDDPRVAAVAPRVRSAEGDDMVARYDRRWSPLDLGDVPARVAAGTRVSYVPSAAMVCRVDAVRSVGGFDPVLRFGEDVDLVWRLVAAGWRVRYEPAAVVTHPPRRGVRAMVSQRAGYGSAAAPLADRHPDALAPMVISPWSALVVVLAVLRHPLLAAGVAAGTGLALQRKLDGVPTAEAWRLVARGHAGAFTQCATAVRRVWWPLVLVAALVSRRARLVLVLSVLPSLLERRNPMGVLDDGAYAWGVWRGMVRSGQWRPLRPKLSGWPPRGAG
jgi:mycofactocin system glycosyltransferase